MLAKKSAFFLIILMAVKLQMTRAIKCYSCHSKRDRNCADPFAVNITGTTLNVVDCSSEVSTRQFISYFSDLMSALGVSVSFNSKYALNKMPEKNQPSACQKVEIIDDNEFITIRDCAILSEIVCDTLQNSSSKRDTSIVYCEVCDSDYCNGAKKLFTNYNLFLLITFINRLMI